MMWQVPFTSPKKTIYHNQVTSPEKARGTGENEKTPQLCFEGISHCVAVYYNNTTSHGLLAYPMPSFELILYV